MRECGCGYSCGTDAALQRHLELAISSHCQPLPEQPWDESLHISAALLQLEGLEASEDTSERLMLAAKGGDAAEVKRALVTCTMSEAALDAAVRGGHVAATSALLLHCRSHSPQYCRPLDGVNVYAASWPRSRPALFLTQPRALCSSKAQGGCPPNLGASPSSNSAPRVWRPAVWRTFSTGRRRDIAASPAP